MTAATSVTWTCPSPDSCPPPSPLPSGPPAALVVSYLVGSALTGAASIVQCIAWIGAMIKQGKRQQWGWFVCTLLFSPLCLWIYLLAVPEAPKALKPVFTQPAQPIYQPYAQGYGSSQSVHESSWEYQEGGQQFPYSEHKPQQQYSEGLMVTYPEE